MTTENLRSGLALTHESWRNILVGDVLMFHDGKTLATVTSIRLGEGTFQTDAPGLESRYYHFSFWNFVGRPDDQGWMTYSGGLNPVPGQIVDWRMRSIHVRIEVPSEEVPWDRVSKFRIHRPASHASTVTYVSDSITSIPRNLVDFDRVSLLVTQPMRDAARRSGKSLNDWISNTIHEALRR